MLFFAILSAIMIIDGKAIAQKILAEVKVEVSTMKQSPRLTVFTCAPNFETQKFLALKQKRAAEVGITVEVVSLDPAIVTVEVIRIIAESLTQTDGVIIQLPFPPSIDIVTVLGTVPAAFDVDALNYVPSDEALLPPVVGAIDAVAIDAKLDWHNKKVVVVGNGRLVGTPASQYATHKGAQVTIIEKDTIGTELTLKEADILILGAGVPGLVTASMVKQGVVVFDAGTSEEGGMLVGDADPNVAKKAALITPVPGGIGPITIAVLLRNLVKLTQNQ